MKLSSLIKRKQPGSGHANGADGEASGAVDAKKRSVRYRGLTLLRFNLLTALICSLLIAGFGVVTFYKFQQQVAKGQQLQVMTGAERVAAHIGGRLSTLTAMVDAIAADEALISTASSGVIEPGSPVGLRLSELASFFPNLLRIRLVFPGLAEPDNSTRPALSYACLEQIHAVEKGKPALVEVHRFNTDDQHIDLVRPLKSGERQVATLLVSLDVKILSTWLRQAGIGEAFVELRQQAGGTLLLTSHGVVALKQGAPAHSVQIVGSRWLLDYWQPLNAMVEAPDSQVVMVLVALAMAFVSLTILGFSAYADHMFKDDLVRLMSLMLELFQGKTPRPIEIRFLDVRESVAALEQVHRNQRQTPKPKTSVEDGFNMRLDDDDLSPPDPRFLSTATTMGSDEFHGEVDDNVQGHGSMGTSPVADADVTEPSESVAEMEFTPSPVDALVADMEGEPETTLESKTDDQPEPKAEMTPLEFESIAIPEDDKKG